jgi:hypothetical protein
MSRVRRSAAVAALILGVVAAAAVTATVGGASSTAAAATPSTSPTCQLGNGVKHVVEILFDNTHYNRDNPNVLSDLEQMPALKDFITNHGTLLSNMHTPLIAHTADDSLTGYTGLYGDRHGQGLTNTYETYQANGSVVPKSSFAYWTSTYGVDQFPNMPYSPNVPAAGSPPRTPPAPWVPFTRAGCNVGDVSTANMVLENARPDLANFFGPNSPEVAQLNADPDSFSDAEVADYEGIGVHCAQGSAFCADAQAIKFGQSTPSHTAVTDSLPDEPGGYTGFQALFGHKYVAPQLGAGTPNLMHNGYQVTNAAGNLVDLSGNEMDGAFLTNHPGFPGFGGISAAQTLAYTADMLETGVPVVYGYISDAHEKKSGQSGCSSPGTALGPADACYKATLKSYDTAFTTFFKRLAADGIDPSNTVFMFSEEESDHFAGANAGRAVTPTCTGTPGDIGYSCSYSTSQIGEQQVSIHGLLSSQLGDTTPFYNEPQGNSVFITGNPGPTSPTTRKLERDFLNVTANDSYDNKTETVSQYEVDPTVERLLHFVNADPRRTPSFTVWPRPDFYLSTGLGDPTSNPKTPNCATSTPAASATNCVVINNGFSWNHGYYAPEVNNTWLGIVGPGVANKGVDGRSAADGPNSADGANSDPKLDTQSNDPGTWGDETDIRPTLLALAGLKDDYVGDGRVLTEDMTFTPGKTGEALFQPLAVCYKQLNSSVGQFGTDLIVADTRALKTGSSTNDSTYQSVNSSIVWLGVFRDLLATEIKNQLAGAEFDNVPLFQGASDLAGCHAILAAANALAK